MTVKDGENTAVLKANVTPESTPVAPAYAAAVISGITVTEQITSKTENNQTVYTYVMDISATPLSIMSMWLLEARMRSKRKPLPLPSL